ncbi:MAG: bifunctional glutamate N-acetyltransferase/amino-acid acetyltransferase ArgJ [Oscillospiraceae bacterium]|jgi:glutamate N-acetyltransferase/amino-acid N-acetyltransferase|nr:bifunctional glutamate N-acetyltransferase/amino-acid acetyltransferase ArgJ [Oscillospiraceae bacterium]
MQIQWLPGGVCAPKGFKAGGIHCGIRKNAHKKDLALVLADDPCAAAAVYTRNKVFGAPITVTRAHLADGKAQAFICNSGNANTCSADGVELADAMCGALAKVVGVGANDVIIASTGVIGQRLPIEPILAGMPSLAASVSADASGASAAAEAIMTTDTRDKQAALSVDIDETPVTIGAMCKGSGMIAPNMATMLCCVTTDADIDVGLLRGALFVAVDHTFNRVVVDGDTSTNDMVSIMAGGKAGNPRIVSDGAAFDTFAAALTTLLTKLAREVARDGEGATKLITANISGAPDDRLARDIARSVVTSPLVKTAIFGADANMGRVLCAIGYTPGDFSVDTIAVSIASDAGELLVCENGMAYPFSEEKALAILKCPEIDLNINMNQGGGNATAWGCDLTYEYVHINGDYRS